MVHISIKTTLLVIFQLVGLVEKRIAAKLQGTRGALLHDGMSCNGVQYVAAIGSY